MNRRVRFSLLYYLWVFTLILLIQWAFFGPAIPTISYSEFIDRVRSGAVEDVAIAQ
jgi:hypothetical protein